MPGSDKDGSISMLFVVSSLEPVIERGGDVEALMVSAGIAPDRLCEDRARVSPQDFAALWLGVAATLDDELFGQDARRMKPGSFAMLCQALVQSSTLGGALHRMTRIFNLLLDDFQCALVDDGQSARLEVNHTPGRRASAVFGTEVLLVMQQGVACWLIGRRIALSRAQFSYPPPPCSAEYPAMFGTELAFMQPVTCLSFDRSYLALPVIQDSKSAARFVRLAPANILIKYKNSEGVAARIRRRLLAAALCDWPTFDGIATCFHMTPSTLRRRLQDEGQTYQSIKDQVRRDLAIEHLCHSSDSLSTIAWQLGFSELSGFHRAFKKWTGANPGEYRAARHHGRGLS